MKREWSYFSWCMLCIFLLSLRQNMFHQPTSVSILCSYIVLKSTEVILYFMLFASWPFYTYRGSAHPWRLPRRGHGNAEGVHKKPQSWTEAGRAQLGVLGERKPVRSLACQAFYRDSLNEGFGVNVSVINLYRNASEVETCSEYIVL